MGEPLGAQKPAPDLEQKKPVVEKQLYLHQLTLRVGDTTYLMRVQSDRKFASSTSLMKSMGISSSMDLRSAWRAGKVELYKENGALLDQSDKQTLARELVNASIQATLVRALPVNTVKM